MTSLLILAFSGCSQKEPQVVIKKELVCVTQYKTERPNANIKILNEDWNIEIAKAYKDSLNEVFDFYEDQVDRNNRMCK